MRTSPIMLNDKALALRYDASTASTFVLIQGCVEKDLDTLYEWLRTMQRYGGHPLLMIALFFDMYHRELRDAYVQLRTSYLEHFLETFSQKFDKLVKYRKQLQAATNLYESHMTEEAEISALRMRLSKFMESVRFVAEYAKPQEKQYMTYHSGRIIDRLQVMSDNLEYLQTKCANTKEGLQLLISSMGSMSALAESEISQQVSIASKRDSSIMMAIAVGTLTFLPATAMASIFAMPVLNWDAPPGEGVTDHRFWIYLVVTIPITVVTLIFLFGWMNMVDYEADTSKTTIKKSVRNRLSSLIDPRLTDRFKRRKGSPPGASKV
jgi:hypothetical protein